MIYEWDPEKAAANLKKHKGSFPEGTSVFTDVQDLKIQGVAGLDAVVLRERDSPSGICLHEHGPAPPITTNAIPETDMVGTAYMPILGYQQGSEIRRFVQQSAPICSGLRYRMVVGQIQDITVGDAPLDDARVYSSAANPSQASRMSAVDMLDKRDTKRRWSDVVIDAIRKARTITPAYDGRRIVVETPRSAGRVQ